MAYQTGIAQNERDLIEKLRQFLTSDPYLVKMGQQWEQLAEITIPATRTEEEIKKYAFVNRHTGTEQAIYCAFYTRNSKTKDKYNLEFIGGTFFEAKKIEGNSIGSGMQNKSKEIGLFCDNRPFEYHFIADSRTIKIVTRVGGQVTSVGYIGFILPNVPPAEYPYPLGIAGSYCSTNKGGSDQFPRYSSTGDEYHCSILNPANGNCWLFTPDQVWRDFTGTKHYSHTNDSQYQGLMPMYCYKSGEGSNQLYILQTMISSPGGATPMIPLEFISTENSTQGRNRWGIFDGVYWVPGVKRNYGDRLQVDAYRQALVVNAGYRTATDSYFVVTYDLPEEGV